MFKFFKGKEKGNVLYAPCKGKVVPLTEYSRAAEPPVQCGVSHLSRRTEPHCL